ncbi:MAG: YraN family protein [Candidatus Nealsonbacteria bacterium]|nr:YraN family protein [Candidatus Nealsonbacteria bacterium]
MSKEFNLKTGKLGERIAGEFLEKKGYKILEQNYKTKYGEIDLICQKGDELIIIEVRTKIGEDFGTPEESLDKKKIRKVWLNALAYVGKNNWKGNYRTDAVCIVLKAGGEIERINHYENIT